MCDVALSSDDMLQLQKIQLHGPLEGGCCVLPRKSQCNSKIFLEAMSVLNALLKP